MSSSTLWATASKEWVIQPKPKPGRKPKKEPPIALKDELEVDAKGRRCQNRAAQRAFRERKQSQLSELQARIQSYEQGEIERNVALQSIAKRLKEENDQLRQENIALQSRIAQMLVDTEKGVDEIYQTVDKKRWRDDSPQSATSLQLSARKKFKKTPDADDGITSLQSSRLPSPSSITSTPNSITTTCTPYPPHQYGSPTDEYNAFHDLSSEVKSANDMLGSFVSFGCGFCDAGNICVCQEIAVHEGDQPIDYKNDFSNSELLQINQDNDHIKDVDIQPSILDNLPAYQPPLPLRRRATGVQVNSVFAVTSESLVERTSEATCSGDPSNCFACGDDAFGKAFCDAIGNTTIAQKSCDNCPGGSQCSDQGFTESNPFHDSSESNSLQSDLMPTNAAWQQLKAHPNVDFADLSLLAEVVASRSKCLGPRVLMSSPNIQNSASLPFGLDERQKQQQRRQDSPLRLVPQEVLLECGRRSLRHVHADGVREALRLLDAKFS